MDEEDQKDIIRKIKTSGAESDVDSSDDSLGIDDEEPSEEPAKDGGDEFEFEDLDSKEELEESDDYSNYSDLGPDWDDEELGRVDRTNNITGRKARKAGKADVKKDTYHLPDGSSVLHTDKLPSEKWPKHVLPYDVFDNIDETADGYDFSEEKKVIEVIKRLRDTGMELTVDNVMVGSLFKPGGTVTDKNLIKAVLDVYTSHVEESMAASEITEEENPCWDGYEMVGMKMKGGKEVPNCVPKQNENEETGEFGSNNYMFWQNLSTIKKSIDDLMSMDKSKVDALLNNGHGWALDHMATSADDVEEVYHFIDARYSGNEDEYYGSVDSINEAEYKGKDVELNKPSRGDVKKYKVYVKNDKGNVVKVNFGDKNMEIKRDDPERRKSFRARHKCDNPGPKWKAKYWSCKFWSSTPISDLLGEGLQDSEKNGKFVETDSMKDAIKSKLQEMKESTAPAPAKPKVDPKVKPSPKRKKIWETKPAVKPKPKMESDNDETNDNA